MQYQIKGDFYNGYITYAGFCCQSPNYYSDDVARRRIWFEKFNLVQTTALAHLLAQYIFLANTSKLLGQYLIWLPI